MNDFEIRSLSPQGLNRWIQEGRHFVLLDVREDEELAICTLPGSLHIPMNLIILRHNELPDDLPIVVYCHHGVRSLNVARFLQQAGFSDLYNLSGGIDAWARQIDTDMARYG